MEKQKTVCNGSPFILTNPPAAGNTLDPITRQLNVKKTNGNAVSAQQSETDDQWKLVGQTAETAEVDSLRTQSSISAAPWRICKNRTTLADRRGSNKCHATIRVRMSSREMGMFNRTPVGGALKSEEDRNQRAHRSNKANRFIKSAFSEKWEQTEQSGCRSSPLLTW